MNAANVLHHVIEIIEKRESTYGDFAITAMRTAQVQTLLHEEFRTAETWLLDMVATKLARMHQAPEHLDNYYDAIAYLAQLAAMYGTDWDK